MINLTRIINSLNKSVVSFEKIGTIPIIWILILCQFVFLIVLRPLFPEYWEAGWLTVVMIYILMTIVFLYLQNKIPSEYRPRNASLQETMVFYPITFLGMYIALYALKQFGYFAEPQIPQLALVTNCLLHIFIVAPSEEIMFRGAIYHTLKWKTKSIAISMIITSLLFAFFHIGVYGTFGLGSIMLLLTAFMMSILFCVLTDKVGLIVAMACHACWNCVAIGLWILQPELITTLLGI